MGDRAPAADGSRHNAPPFHPADRKVAEANGEGYGSSDSEGEGGDGAEAREGGGEPEPQDVRDGGISVHGLVRRMAKLADDR